MNDSIPIKWKKYLKLYEFGFRDLADLNNEIHRFRIQDIHLLINEISTELANSTAQNIKMFFVIKMININAYFKVPNFRIYNLDDLFQFSIDIADKGYLYHEIWYCKTYIDLNNKLPSLAGRILFEKYTNGYSQIIEQIWNKSPRFIDNYSSLCDFIFARANRLSWGFRYNLTDIYIPNDCTIEKDIILQQFYNAVKKIEQERENIEKFEDYMYNFDFKSFCLEYKIDCNTLRFIDWDSPNDLLVLQ